LTHASAAIAEYGIVIVALVIFLGELGVPVLVPGELMLFLTGNEIVSSIPAFLAVWLGIAAVDWTASMILQGAFRLGGSVLLVRIVHRFSKSVDSPEETIARWRSKTGGHDVPALWIVRAIPWVRISGTMVSGLLRLPMRAVALGLAGGSLTWVFTPLLLGYLIRLHVGRVSRLDPHALILLGILMAAIVVVGGAIWWIVRVRRPRVRRKQGSEWKSV
jgi:membrane protein DedA with SNARE-associated domain